MSNKPKVLIQFDSDQHPSVFDSVVAVDAGVDHLLPFGNIEPVDVRNLVHGAMFTRGGDSLRNTAIFIGGSRVDTAEQVLRSVKESFFGPVRVSVMLDANGANTTAAAAVLCLQRHMDPADRTIAVLGATGSVGCRVVRLLAKKGAHVRVASRRLSRAKSLCDQIGNVNDKATLTPFETDSPRDYDTIMDGCDGLISSGAAGFQLIREDQWTHQDQLEVAIDLNAVPPSGVEGIDATATGDVSNDVHLFGALGVGNLKMKIHRRAIQALFETNDLVIDVDEVYSLGEKIEESRAS